MPNDFALLLRDKNGDRKRSARAFLLASTARESRSGGMKHEPRPADRVKSAGERVWSLEGEGVPPLRHPKEREALRAGGIRMVFAREVLWWSL